MEKAATIRIHQKLFCFAGRAWPIGASHSILLLLFHSHVETELSMTGAWSDMIFKVPFNPNHDSMSWASQLDPRNARIAGNNKELCKGIIFEIKVR